jgi:hypothetical protein
MYVEDLVIIANMHSIGLINDQMRKRFRIHEFWSDSFYLGTNIKCHREHHTIDTHQQSHILMILAKLRMDESRLVATPMAMKLPKRKPNEKSCTPTRHQLMI